MHAIRGGWVGRTFALAKCNDSDSGGKKSRIRRSKEERKAMVESFITKYQKSNDGNFPSLNLTHKEVGGSFYTVREIVREIIQENRVLGPATTNLVGQKNDQFLEENPLGFIATEPQITVISAINEVDQHTAHEEFTPISDASLNGSEQLDGQGSQTIDGSRVDVMKDDVDRLDLESLLVNESVEIGKGLDCVASLTSTCDFTDVEVETFPLTTVGDHTERSVCEVVTVNGTLPEKILGISSESGSNSGLLHEATLEEERSSVNHEIKAVSGPAGSLVGQQPVSVDVKAVEVLVSMSTAALDKASEMADVISDSEGGAQFGDDTTNFQVLPSSGTRHGLDIAKMADSPSDVDAGKFNGTYATTVIEKSPRGEKMESKNDIQSNSHGSFPLGSTPALDRINLESWEVTSKKSLKQEIHPLLAIFKLFVSFIKFWTE